MDHEERYGGPFSDQFKDLMNSMLAYQPFLRPCIVDVLAHPFFPTGSPVATQEAVIAEMSDRKNRMNHEDSERDD